MVTSMPSAEVTHVPMNAPGSLTMAGAGESALRPPADTFVFELSCFELFSVERFGFRVRFA